MQYKDWQSTGLQQSWSKGDVPDRRPRETRWDAYGWTRMWESRPLLCSQMTCDTHLWSLLRLTRPFVMIEKVWRRQGCHSPNLLWLSHHVCTSPDNPDPAAPIPRTHRAIASHGRLCSQNHSLNWVVSCTLLYPCETTSPPMFSILRVFVRPS